MKTANKINLITVQEWLVNKISSLTGINEKNINLTRPLSEYGLDSIHAVGLSGDIEEWTGLSIEPTIVWDYPSIELLSHYLVDEISSHQQRTDPTDPQHKVA
jgi:acyl carrier protein